MNGFQVDLERYIQRICNREIEKKLKYFEVSGYGIVKDTDNVNKMANVEIAGQQGETGMIKNVTGEDLSVGDSVKFYYVGNVSNGYIGIKMG